jgi:hypothetical protein
VTRLSGADIKNLLPDNAETKLIQAECFGCHSMAHHPPSREHCERMAGFSSHDDARKISRCDRSQAKPQRHPGEIRRAYGSTGKIFWSGFSVSQSRC